MSDYQEFEYKMKKTCEALSTTLATIRAGRANMFLSPLFRSTLATLCGASIELFDTDGSLGAARGAALGAGIYKTAGEAFSTLRRLDVIQPVPAWTQPLEDAYGRWKFEVERTIQK